MKKLILVSILSAILCVGCGKDKDDIQTEVTVISGGMSYYLSEVNYTIIDYNINSYDINKNNIIVVNYVVDDKGLPIILKIEDDIK